MNKKIKNTKILIIFSLIVIIILLLASNVEKIKNSTIIKKFLEPETQAITYEIKGNNAEKYNALITINSTQGIESIKYINSQGEEIKLDCENKLSVGIDYVVEYQNTYYFTVKRIGEAEKVEAVYIKTPDILDFISKLPSPIYNGTSDEYFNIGGYYVGGFNANSFYKKSGYDGLTTNPVIIASDTGAYTYMYTKNKLESNIRKIEIEVRTRNDGTNYGPAYIGLVSNPGATPTWITNAYVNWNSSTTSSWTTYTNTINIPSEINSTNYYFEVFLGHEGHAYTMWMDFITLKGTYN